MQGVHTPFQHFAAQYQIWYISTLQRDTQVESPCSNFTHVHYYYQIGPHFFSVVNISLCSVFKTSCNVCTFMYENITAWHLSPLGFDSHLSV